VFIGVMKKPMTEVEMNATQIMLGEGYTPYLIEVAKQNAGKVWAKYTTMAANKEAVCVA
jgi:hypothetical protein